MLDRTSFRILPPLAGTMNIKEALGDRKTLTGDEIANLIEKYFDPVDTVLIVARVGNKAIPFHTEPESVICMLEDDHDIIMPISIEGGCDAWEGFRVMLG